MEFNDEDFKINSFELERQMNNVLKDHKNQLFSLSLSRPNVNNLQSRNSETNYHSEDQDVMQIESLNQLQSI